MAARRGIAVAAEVTGSRAPRPRLPSQRPCYAPEGAKVGAEQRRLLADLVRGAGGKLACLTGAGFSTESGVPDYRGPEGSYSKGHKPMKHQEFVGEPANRARYWARSLGGWRFFDGARPNAAHQALAALEHRGFVSGVVTQNVDRLHQRAGSVNVVDLHGRNDEVACLGCDKRRERAGFQRELEAVNAEWIREFLPKSRIADVRADGDAHLKVNDFAGFQVPSCSSCGGVWMPRIVFFGGALRPEVRDAAQAVVDQAEALLVLGTSSQVFSAFRLVRAAKEAGKPIALVNIGETRVDTLIPPHMRFPLRCGEALQAICGELGVEVPEAAAP